jgi:DNA polymerase-3 subunit alpha
LWLKSEDELNEFWEAKFADTIDYELYKEAKANTVKIAELAKGVKLDREVKLPRIPDAELKLWDEVKKGFIARGCPKEPTYVKRIREEYDLIVEKGFASYFIIQKMMVDEARDYTAKQLGFDGVYGVGPGRGSVCGSLLAYCLRLHDLDPIRHDLRFSRFLSPARGGKQTKFRHSIKPVPHEDIAA